MDSDTPRTNNCPECGRPVEIFNGDFEFSMELHKQSHKSLEVINKLNHTQGKIENSSRCNMKYCNDCKEHIEIINNNVSLSLQLHAQKHKPENVYVLSDHLSTSSENPIIFQNKTLAEEKAQATPVLSSSVEAIFHTMPIGLKAHRGFILEKSCNQAFCNLCEINIEPIFVVTEHLKTKLHEDNIIQVITSLLASELQDQMEFVSFYDSNLSCNLCKSKIDLCSNNLHETVVNISTHNASKGHWDKKTDMSANSQCEKPLVVLRNLALMDPTVNENKNFIEHGMNPYYTYYKCKLCNTAISYSENEEELLNNFKCHFNSPDHKTMHFKSDLVSILNKWNDLNVTGKENPTSTNTPNAQIDLQTSREENIQSNRDHMNQLSKPVPEEQQPSTRTKQLETIKIDDRCTGKKYRKQLFAKELSYKLDQSQLVDIQTNRKYLMMNQDGKKIDCTLCKRTIHSAKKVDTLQNILQHFEGAEHVRIKAGGAVKVEKKKGAAEKKARGAEYFKNKAPPCLPSKEENIQQIGEPINQTGKPVTGEPLPSTSKNMLVKKKDDVKAQYKELLTTNATIKCNSVYLENENDSYKCKLCKAVVVCGNELKLLEENIMSHITGKEHKEQLAEEFNGILDKVPIHKAVVKENRQFLMIKDEYVLCTPCDCKISTIPSADNVHKFTKCLLKHVKRSTHVKKKEFNEILDKVQITNAVVKENRQFLMIKDEYVLCTPCDCKISTIPSADNVHKFTECLLIHLKGSTHVKKKHQKQVWDKVQLTNAVVKENRQFLMIKDEYVLCTPCDCKISTIPSADNVDTFTKCLLIHLKGSTHVKKKHQKQVVEEFNDILDKVQLTNADIQTNRKYLMKKGRKVHCTLCKCTIPLADNVDAFTKCLLIHLKGAVHVKNKAGGAVDVKKKAAVEGSDSSASVEADNVDAFTKRLLIHLMGAVHVKNKAGGAVDVKKKAAVEGSDSSASVNSSEIVKSYPQAGGKESVKLISYVQIEES